MIVSSLLYLFLSSSVLGQLLHPNGRSNVSLSASPVSASNITTNTTLCFNLTYSPENTHQWIAEYILYFKHNNSLLGSVPVAWTAPRSNFSQQTIGTLDSWLSNSSRFAELNVSPWIVSVSLVWKEVSDISRAVVGVQSQPGPSFIVLPTSAVSKSNLTADDGNTFNTSSTSPTAADTPIMSKSPVSSSTTATATATVSPSVSTSTLKPPSPAVSSPAQSYAFMSVPSLTSLLLAFPLLAL